MSGSMVTMDQWAQARGVSARTARRWLGDGKIPGAVKSAGAWQIPEDAPAPFTAPAHMRPVGATVAGEVVGPAVHAAAVAMPGPAALQRWTPEQPVFTPDTLPALLTIEQVIALFGGNVSERSVLAMINEGELTGVRRGRPRSNRGRPTWLVPLAEVRRLRGPQ